MNLITAAQYGDTEELERLLKAGADPNERNEGGETALMWAALAGNRNMVRRLLDSGSDPNTRSRSRWALSTGSAGATGARRSSARACCERCQRERPRRSRNDSVDARRGPRPYGSGAPAPRGG